VEFISNKDSNTHSLIHSLTDTYFYKPRAGSGVVRIDPLHFLARCRTRRL